MSVLVKLLPISKFREKCLLNLLILNKNLFYYLEINLSDTIITNENH